jgi:hypothetical protein
VRLVLQADAATDALLQHVPCVKSLSVLSVPAKKHCPMHITCAMRHVKCTHIANRIGLGCVRLYEITTLFTRVTEVAVDSLEAQIILHDPLIFPKLTRLVVSGEKLPRGLCRPAVEVVYRNTIPQLAFCASDNAYWGPGSREAHFQDRVLGAYANY